MSSQNARRAPLASTSVSPSSTSCRVLVVVLISEITRPDIARLHHELARKPYQANRTLALLSKFFNWAEKHGLRLDGSNPCRHVEKYRETRRERFLSEGELARLGDALRAAERDESATVWTIAAIRLLTFTGARLSEILTLKWAYVNEEHGLLLLPDSRQDARPFT